MAETKHTDATILDGVAAALKARGVVPVDRSVANRKNWKGEDRDTEILRVRGVDVTPRIDVQNEMTGSQWRPQPTGNKVVVVRGERRVNYKQRKDGTWNFEAMAETIDAWSLVELKRQAAEGRRDRNKVASESVRADASYKRLADRGVRYSVTASTDEDKPVDATFSFRIEGDADRVTRIANAILAAIEENKR